MRLLGGKGAVFAAIALGALTSYIAWRYVDQASQAQPVQTAPVVVAAAPIAPRTIITPDLVRVQTLPVEAVHPSAAHSTAEVIGKVARISMTADEQVLSTKLFLQREDSGLAFMVPPGMRAVSVGVSEVIGSGGMILPGDHVDVIGVFEIKTPALPTPTGPAAATATPAPPIVQKDDRAVLNTGAAGPGEMVSTPIATIVLEDISILAIAQRVEGEDTRDNNQRFVQNTGLAGPAGPGGQQQQQQVRSDPQPLPGAKTATLAVSPEDALKLVLAEDRGKIRLALRRSKDDSTPQVAQVPMTNLLQPRSGR